MQMLDADIPYFHSVVDNMAINGTPVKTRYDAPSSITVQEPTVQDAINSVIQVCHFYTTYADEELSEVGMSNGNDPN